MSILFIAVTILTLLALLYRRVNILSLLQPRVPIVSLVPILKPVPLSVPTVIMASTVQARPVHLVLLA